MAIICKPDLSLVPFRAEHLYSLVDRDGSEPHTIAQAMEKENGVAFSGMYGDKIIGCAGVIIAWPGMGVAWAVFARDIGDYGLWTTRMVRRALRDIIRSNNLHRVEMVVLEGNERNARWAEMLGFEREKGVAKHYCTDKRNVVRYEFIV